jgi:putative membrane-bound dehydrogenase-like protein
VIGEDGKKKIEKIGKSAELQKAIKQGEWNDYHIIADGFTFTHKINGKVMTILTDNDKRHRDKGILAFQVHAGPPMTVQFKDVQLKRLGDNDAAKGDAAKKTSSLPASSSKTATRTAADGKKKKICFVAGNKSHGYGSHEHKAGCMLLAKCLNESGLPVEAVVHTNGWPKDASFFDGADAVVMYCDGGGRHFANAHLDQINALANKGVGIGCIHYGVETLKGQPGDRFMQWTGGYFEPHWSVNPHWTAEYEKLPEHSITRGVKPFAVNDEWYYHMRFRPEMKGVTPLLTALPPKETLKRKDGAHSGNPEVRKAVLERKEPQHTAWCSENEDGSRGFGFTGGHFHWNWGHPDFRKLVLNAVYWTAKGEVPADGVKSRVTKIEELTANQDYPKGRNFDAKKMQKQIDGWNGKAAGETPSASETSKPSGNKPESKKKEQRSPSEAVGGLDVGEGLQAGLFAAEPMIANPSNIDIDHRGRVWVCEIVNYRHQKGKRPEGDRIVILEDTNGDAVADKETVFYQGKDFYSPHGICVLATPDGKNTKAIVSVGDKVIVLTDVDGDDKADKQEVLFTGISGTQHDHGIHAFVFGPDGKLYFNFGNAGKQIKDAAGKPIVDKAGNTITANRKPYQQGMVFRCNLDGSEVETLGWNFRNNWMATVDSFGTIWQSDNDDDGNRGVRINYVMEYGNYGYKDERTGAGWKSKRTNPEKEIPLRHWHLNDPGVVPNLLQTGAGSPTGITVYEGDLLPKQFQGQVIHTDAGPNVCRAYPAENDGAGYKATIANILTGTRDKWFRPSDVSVAPDGSLIIADWYDPGVGGHRAGDIAKGRLFRITPTGDKAKYTTAKFDFSTAQGAAEALKSPNYAARYIAWQALHKMGAQAEAALTKLWKSDNPRHRARALWLLGKIEGKSQQYVDAALADKDANIRITGIRLARQTGVDLTAVAKKMAKDASPQVRREVAIVLRHLDSSEVPNIWAELAMQHDGKDRWYLEALGIGAGSRWDECLAAWQAKAGAKWMTPAGRDIVWRSRAKQTPMLLAEIIKNTDPKQHPRYMRAFDFLSGPEKDQALKSILGF